MTQYAGGLPEVASKRQSIRRPVTANHVAGAHRFDETVELMTWLDNFTVKLSVIRTTGLVYIKRTAQGVHVKLFRYSALKLSAKRRISLLHFHFVFFTITLVWWWQVRSPKPERKAL